MKAIVLITLLTICATAAQAQFAVSGKVWDYNRIDGVARVQLSFAVHPLSTNPQSCNVPASVLTDRSGKWSQTGFTDGCMYVVKPYKPSYYFRLAQLIISRPGSSYFFYRS